MTDPESLPLPSFVDWPIFPFVGEMQVREVQPHRAQDYPRDGEPGGAPRTSTCGSTAVRWATPR